jgi:hypothetical protein
MTVIQSVSIRPGHLLGSASWDSRLQTYVASLRLFDPRQPYPPPSARHGIRTGEFVTVDALANHLAGIGLELDDASRAELVRLSQHIAATEGETEIVGLTDPFGGRHLFVVTPSRLMLRLNPRIDHRDYRLNWGDAGPATVETARLICEQVWVRAPAHDFDTFALAFTMEHLALVGPDFAFSAATLCDWYLTDSGLRTTLSEDDLAALRRRLGLMLRRE